MQQISWIIVAVAIALESGAMRAEEIQVKKWPDDVPCNAVKKNPDGSYVQLRDLMMGNMRMSKNTYGKDTGEARAWERKCIGKSG